MKGGKEKGMGLLIGVGPEPDDMDEPAEDEMREAKVTAARALLSSIKGNDPEGIVDAYDALRECY
jgi:hypothetical protein